MVIELRTFEHHRCGLPEPATVKNDASSPQKTYAHCTACDSWYVPIGSVKWGRTDDPTKDPNTIEVVSAGSSVAERDEP